MNRTLKTFVSPSFLTICFKTEQMKSIIKKYKDSIEFSGPII